jgi:hypothetical protein
MCRAKRGSYLMRRSSARPTLGTIVLHNQMNGFSEGDPLALQVLPRGSAQRSAQCSARGDAEARVNPVPSCPGTRRIGCALDARGTPPAIRPLQRDGLHHDTNGTAGQAVDVVPDGSDQMDEPLAGQQSLQSGAVESGEKRAIQDFFPAPPLAGSGEIFQMLRLRMHDVAVGRSRCEDRILWAGG